MKIKHSKNRAARRQTATRVLALVLAALLLLSVGAVAFTALVHA